MQHNAEIDACDLAMEIERLDLLEQFVDKNTFHRVCLYMTRFVCWDYLFFHTLSPVRPEIPVQCIIPDISISGLTSAQPN